MAEPIPVSEPGQPLPPLGPPRSVLHWNMAALLVAIAAIAGSLWLSLVMGLHACPLCYYQRALVMASAALLLMALLTESRASASIALLAMPAAMAGLGVAGWHVYLELSNKLECPLGLLGLGTAPQQSLAAHILLVLFLTLAGIRRPALAVAVVLGGLLAFAAVSSVAPMRPPPAESYNEPPRVCRPPLRAQ